MEHQKTFLSLTVFCFFALFFSLSVQSESLYLISTHTKEQFKGTFKEKGVYNEKNCKKIDYLLRDHRTNEIHKIDRQLLDDVYEVTKKISPLNPQGVCVHIVSGYRSGKTNAMLRRKCAKVSKNSYHMAGKALDFFVDSISIKKLAQIAKSLDRGGVGTYVQAGFIHMDRGRPRWWGC